MKAPDGFHQRLAQNPRQDSTSTVHQDRDALATPEGCKMERLETHRLGLLRRIAAGMNLIEKPADLQLLDELIEQGYADGVETTFSGQRLFLDVRTLPKGDLYLMRSRPPGSS
ncbi:hypothetical protein ACNPNU_27325 [Pseudomonas shirazica]|jgi:hypothetical protein|nr:hypothetical protein [Pseudomonas plecoglossicida]